MKRKRTQPADVRRNARRGRRSDPPVLPLDERLAAPRYHQVYVTLRQWVRDGTYQAGEQIPTEPELCATFGVSRITIRKALEELVREGWLVRQQGRGTFVDMAASRANLSVDVSQLVNYVEGLGRKTTVRGLELGEVEPDDETRAALGLKVGERVQRAVHVRLLNGEPLGQITTFVPLDVAARIEPADLERTPMLRLLERAGISVGDAEQFLGATLADVAAAKALAVAVGTPLVKLTRTVSDTRRRPVERVIALYRADRYHYRMQLTRARPHARGDWITS